MPVLSSGPFPADLEHALGYSFKRPELPLEALTHRTFSHESADLAPAFNERLEFLGDSVLGLLIGEELFLRCPDWNEGRLSKLKAALVRDTTLARLAARIDLGQHLRLGRGENQSGGRERPSILAAAFEAILAAVYLDGGLDPARGVVKKVFAEEIGAAIRKGGLDDAKTALQELCHRQSLPQPEYRVIHEEGPDHDKTFRIEVLAGDRSLGQGKGKSKKEAEQAAARMAIGQLTTSES